MPTIQGAQHHHHLLPAKGDSRSEPLRPGRPRRTVLHRRRRWLRRLLHAPVRPRAGSAVADTGLPQHGVALRLRRRHVLLLLRRLRPRRRQCDRYVRNRKDDALDRTHDRPCDAEGVARRTVPRGHRLRLPLPLGAARNRGHAEVAAGGEQDDEEGVKGQHRDHHLLLPRVRVLRLRGVRRRHAGEPPHRLRRALLAHRPRQPLRRPPPPRRIPAVQPAGVRRRGAAVRHGGLGRRGGAASARPAAQCERVQAVLPHGVRGGGDGGGRVVPLLQPGGGAHRCLHLLAAGHPPPRGDVPRAGQGGAVDNAVARYPGLQRHLPTRRRLRLRWIRRGGVRPRHKLS